MYKVILVDDEYYVRKSIQNRVNWAKFDCEIAAEADNGIRALELIGDIKPDIALVDIMMPEMDGLELIRQAKEISPLTQFAILSGYDDFAYTKEAIKLKVVDYIKKPIDVVELEKVVSEMIRLIETGNQARQRYTELVSQAVNLGEMKIERALNDVSSNPDGYLALPDLLKEDKNAWIIVYSTAISGSESGHLAERLKLDITGFTDSIFPGTSYVVINEVDPNEIRILISTQSFDDVQRVSKDLHRYLISHPLLDQKRRVFLVTCQPVTVDELHKEYGSMLEVLKYKLFHGQDGIQISLYKMSSSQDEIDKVFTILESIKFCVVSRQISKLDRVLNQLFSDGLITTPKLLEDALFYLYSFIREYAARYNTDLPEQFTQGMVGYRVLLQYDNLARLKEIIQSLLFQFLCEGCLIDDDHITVQVKKYIDENYHEKLSLKYIAEMFYINASYLSSLFKRKTGVNLNRYIESVRLEHAKALLTNPAITINDVSSMIGYTDPNHFSKTFKKRTGKTPMEYKGDRGSSGILKAK